MTELFKKPMEKIGHYRWIICGLLFFAATINYIDRNVISLLKPMMLEWPGWSELWYGRVISAFTLSYAIMMLFAGAIIDRIGIRKGFLIAIIWWSFAAMGHAFSGTVLSIAIWRILLGIGEAANFPASIKAVAEWFPKRERALATGIFNSGTTIGAMTTPYVVAWILDYFKDGRLEGWQWVFILTGALGFIWVVLWLWIYMRPEEHPSLSKTELAYIQSDQSDEKIEKTPWLPLFKFKQTWAFTIAKCFTDPIWWVWLFWVPGFLKQKFEVDIKSMGVPIMVIYTMAAIGSIGGGWLSARFIKKGWSVNAGRKTVMLICAVCVIPVIYAAETTRLWTAIILIGLACGAHQGWSANLFTTVSDMFPKRAVGSVVGIGGAAGGIGGFVIANYVGKVLDKNPDNYLPVFLIAGSIYLIALIIIQVLVPKLEPAKME